MAQVLDDWRDLTYSQGIDIYAVPGVTRAFAAGRLNYVFGFSGPYYSLDTACSGSSSAIHLACNVLPEGECEMALAGGGIVIQAPFSYFALDRGGFGSWTGGCKTLRAHADGYCRNEGVEVVVLKRSKDAITDKDDISGCDTRVSPQLLNGGTEHYLSGLCCSTTTLSGSPVYLCTGLERVSISDQLCADKTYSTFADFLEASKQQDSTLIGTLTAISDDKVVALCTGVKFQKMPRKIPRAILSKANTEQTGPLSTPSSSEGPSPGGSSRGQNSSMSATTTIGTPAPSTD